MLLNTKKYEQIILYLCKNLGGEIHGKKKLAKLLYYVDFDFYEKYQTQFTKEIYKALPMGPYPESMNKIIEGLQKKKKLSVENKQEWENYNATEVYKMLAEPNDKIFSQDERLILDRVIKLYGHLNGKQLEDLTHNEAPYAATEPQEEISYELSFYRGTDFDV